MLGRGRAEVVLQVWLWNVLVAFVTGALIVFEKRDSWEAHGDRALRILPWNCNAKVSLKIYF